MTTHEMAVNELRDHGYPYAKVTTREVPGADAKSVRLTFAGEPGKIAFWHGDSLSRPAAGNLRHWPAAARDDRFPRSMQEPEPGSRHLHAGQHLASQQASARLIPGQAGEPGFAVI